MNQSGKTYSQDLAKVLTRHDLVEFEPRRVAEQVRTTGRLTVPSSSGTFELTLAPHDLRASNYRAQISLMEEVLGYTLLPPSAIRTEVATKRLEIAAVTPSVSRELILA